MRAVLAGLFTFGGLLVCVIHAAYEQLKRERLKLPHRAA
jgi:hypothetical protein